MTWTIENGKLIVEERSHMVDEVLRTEFDYYFTSDNKSMVLTNTETEKMYIYRSYYYHEGDNEIEDTTCSSAILLTAGLFLIPAIVAKKRIYK
ncbi:MAG TPA: hypothetical protein ENN76_00595 [Euryarchaeota archaeon]|nr:hypothetical protein [Euryarchaeota archaeon]